MPVPGEGQGGEKEPGQGDGGDGNRDEHVQRCQGSRTGDDDDRHENKDA